MEWVADICGDGVGFDILSLNECDDGEQYLEVKTTGLGRYFPFVVTGNEVRCSEAWVYVSRYSERPALPDGVMKRMDELSPGS